MPGKEETERPLESLTGIRQLSTICLQAAHKLNSSLTVIQGYAQLLLEKELDEEGRSFLKKIDQEAQKASKTVTDLVKATNEISQ